MNGSITNSACIVVEATPEDEKTASCPKAAPVGPKPLGFQIVPSTRCANKFHVSGQNLSDDSAVNSIVLMPV